jgi:DNA-binding MarR family transcriptional regulator
MLINMPNRAAAATVRLRGSSVSDAERTGSFRATSLGYQVNHLARLFVRLLADRISRYGVVPGQFPQLIALYERDGLTPTELSRAVDIEPGTMTKTLRRMERDGLVERRPDADDGRAVRIYLTRRARDLEPALIATAGAINSAVTDVLSKTRRREFLRDLRAVIQRSEQLLDESSVRT